MRFSLQGTEKSVWSGDERCNMFAAIHSKKPGPFSDSPRIRVMLTSTRNWVSAHLIVLAVILVACWVYAYYGASALRSYNTGTPYVMTSNQKLFTAIELSVFSIAACLFGVMQDPTIQESIFSRRGSQSARRFDY